jgi:hypothetical protein
VTTNIEFLIFFRAPNEILYRKVILMKSSHYFRNKYFLGCLLIIVLVSADAVWHKGMTRVLIPASFSTSISPSNYLLCNATLMQRQKNWVKAVDNEQAIENLPADTDGFEVDVYFDTAAHSFYVYHDSSERSSLTIGQLLDIYQRRNLKSSIWFDYKNLSYFNQEQSLRAFITLRRKYKLENKMIIESSVIKYLAGFCEHDFFTSYYTPYFNPYELKDKALQNIMDTLSYNLQRYPVAALSGYYFQYPFLKKYFPQYPILTWAEKDQFSLVSLIFNYRLSDDRSLKIILYPQN